VNAKQRNSEQLNTNIFMMWVLMDWTIIKKIYIPEMFYTHSQYWLQNISIPFATTVFVAWVWFIY